MSFNDQPPLTRRQLREQEARGLRRAPESLSVSPAGVDRVIVVRRAAPKKKRGAGRTLLSMGAMFFAAALLVGVTVPASAFMPAGGVAASVKSASGQSVEVSADATADAAARSNYTVTSYAEILRARYGNRSYSYTVGTGPVQWPFPYAVPVSDGFGERIAPCRSCSTFHKGTDFTPGAGTAIYAIADGVVSSTGVTDRGFGNFAIIDHVVGGQRVQSLYAHMQMNSSPMHVGDAVKVGDFVGLVGDTGLSVGAHLHFELHLDGVPIDGFAWLKANAAA